MGAETRADDEAAARLAAGVASYALGAPLDAILRIERGSSEVAFARQVAMYLCHVAFEFSLARVAVAFARDRSTVAHACHVIEDKREDEAFDDWIAALEAMLCDAPPPQQQVTA
ncbi:helix-turn-helix domain-containing protein [Terricaulis sp.]|uniref:helix-turn-helix domain-containing protein n=1 Tax=Terricaulis sp. TaxID=2768686 RepID=UPI003784FF2D